MGKHSANERGESGTTRDQMPAGKDAPARAAASAGAQPLVPDNVLSLQRSIGNRAVVNALARTTMTPEEALADARTRRDYRAMARALRRFPTRDLSAQLAQLELAELAGSGRVAGRLGEHYERVAGAIDRERRRQIDAEWTAALAARSFRRLAAAGEACHDWELRRRLRALSYDDVASYGLAALIWSRTRGRRVAEEVRREKLPREFRRAVDGGNWARAVALADDFADREILERLRAIQRKGPAALTAAATAAASRYGSDNHRVRRILAFLQVEDLVGRKARPAHSDNFRLGRASGSLAVPGGVVRAYERVRDSTGPADWYAFGYFGGAAQRTGWLQFISREIERFDASGRSLGFYTPPGTLTHIGQPGTIAYGSPASPNWYPDTFANAVPFYESPVTAPPGGAALPAWASPVGTRGGHITQPSTEDRAGRTVMVDRPGMVPVHVNGAFTPIPAAPLPPGHHGPAASPTAVAAVESRCRFHVYLTRGMDVLYENTMVVNERYTSAPSAGGVGVRTNTAGRGRRADRLANAHYRALINRFPAFTYFPH